MVLNNNGLSYHGSLSIDLFLEVFLIHGLFEIAAPDRRLFKVYLVHLMLCILIELVCLQVMLFKTLVTYEILDIMALVRNDEGHWKQLELWLMLLVLNVKPQRKSISWNLTDLVLVDGQEPRIFIHLTLLFQAVWIEVDVHIFSVLLQ